MTCIETRLLQILVTILENENVHKAIEDNIPEIRNDILTTLPESESE